MNLQVGKSAIDIRAVTNLFSYLVVGGQMDGKLFQFLHGHSQTCQCLVQALRRVLNNLKTKQRIVAKISIGLLLETFRNLLYMLELFEG